MFAFADPSSCGSGSMGVARGPGNASATWAAFATVTLEEMHVDEASFRRALRRLAAGAVSSGDAARFAARRLGNLSAAERRSFDTAPRIYAGGDEARAYNEHRR